MKRKRKKIKIKERKALIKSMLRKMWFVLLFALLIFIPFYIYRNIKKSVWDGKNNLNLVIQTERTFLYSYHPGDGILNIISLPSDLMIKTAKDYGEYQLANIYQLGEIEKIEGGELLEISLEQFFRVPIDGNIIRIKNYEFQNENIEKGRIAFLYLCLLTRKCKTNMAGWDLLRSFYQFNQLKFNQVRMIKIEETALFKKEKLADQSVVLKLERSLIDDFSQKYFTDKKLLDEGLKINVVNATNYAGLAKENSRLLKNIGAEIITSEDDNQVLEESLIYYRHPEEEKSYSLNKIKQIFQVKEAIFDEEIKGDIKLILAKDFLEKFYLQ